MTLEEMMEKEGFTAAERALVKDIGAPDIRYSNAATILAAKKYEWAIDRLIVSNKNLAKSNSDHSKATIRLTVVIILMTFLNTIISIVLSLQSYTTELFVANKIPADAYFKMMGSKILWGLLFTLLLGLGIYTVNSMKKYI